MSRCTSARVRCTANTPLVAVPLCFRQLRRSPASCRAGAGTGQTTGRDHAEIPRTFGTRSRHMRHRIDRRRRPVCLRCCRPHLGKEWLGSRSWGKSGKCASREMSHHQQHHGTEAVHSGQRVSRQNAAPLFPRAIML